jgi:hypothetical protein
MRSAFWRIAGVRTGSKEVPASGLSRDEATLCTIATCTAPVVVIAFWLVAFSCSVSPAGAQSCRTDFDCNLIGGNNRCLGDTLILVRRLCLGGTCQEQQTGSINCNPSGGAGSCAGNTFVRSGGRCDALAGRCIQGASISVTCVRSCSCQGNRLAISTGACSVGGCVRAVVQCNTGCTCSPEPRCLEDAEPRTRGGRR